MTEISPLDRFILALQNESILSHQPIVVERFKQLLQAHTELAHPGGVTSFTSKPLTSTPASVLQLEATKKRLIEEGERNGTGL